MYTVDLWHYLYMEDSVCITSKGPPINDVSSKGEGGGGVKNVGIYLSPIFLLIQIQLHSAIIGWIIS